MEENAQPPSYNNPPDVPPAPAVPPPPPPMPPNRPPVIVAPPPSKSPGRGRGWMVFALILLALLVISMLFNVGSVVRSVVPASVAPRSRQIGPRLEEVFLEDNSSRNKIAVVDVDGIITSRAIDQSGYNMVDVIKAQLRRAEDEDSVKAVILKVDSPGGEVLASDEISRAIAEFQRKTSKPVVCSMGNLAASGGYYISAPCRWIVANELTITGSIGVIMSTLNYRGLMDKVGLRPETFKSGEYKDMLSGSREPDSITPKEREMVQNLIDETYAKFKSVVSEGRKAAHEKNKEKGRPLSDDWVDYADGRILSGTEAYKLGFVDQLGTFDDSVKQAKNIAKISTASLIEYRQRYDFADIFRMFGETESKMVKVDLGLDAPKLKAGQLYFLSPLSAR